MTELEQLQIGLTMLGVAMAWLCYVAYTRTRADRLREDLFTMRDALFDYMWQTGISFELPAYRLLRDSLNGAIRFVHQLRLAHVLLIAYALRRDLLGRSPVERQIEKIDDHETRLHFKKVHDAMNARIMSCLLFEGPQWIVTRPLFLVSRILHSRKHDRGSPKLRTRPRDIADELLLIGGRNDTAIRIITGVEPPSDAALELAQL